MARQAINIGSTANDGTGDPLRTAFDKINDNFVEVYGALNPSSSNLKFVGDSITSENTNGIITIDPAGTGTIELASSANVTGSLTVTGTVDAVSLSVDTISTASNQNLSITPGGTGSILADGITIKDNTISASNSNDNLVLSASGTGNIVVGAVTVNGTTLSAADSTKLTLAEAVDVTGNLKVDGNVGFYGTAPVAQASAIAFDPSGNDGSTVDDLRQVINSMLTALRNVGIIAS
jgi:hypothetical protein